TVPGSASSSALSSAPIAGSAVPGTTPVEQVANRTITVAEEQVAGRTIPAPADPAAPAETIARRPAISTGPDPVVVDAPASVEAVRSRTDETPATSGLSSMPSRFANEGPGLATARALPRAGEGLSAGTSLWLPMLLWVGGLLL